MLTNSMKRLRRCLRSKSYVVDPGKTSESADGYEFVEVKPGRVLRVRHIIPDRPVVEEPTEQGGSVSSTEEQHCANSSPPVSLPEDKSESLTAGKDGTHPDEVLFFIHGVGGSVGVWRSQLDFFSRQGYEVIAVDLAGHGASSAPRIAAAYTFYALADDMRLIFKRYARKKNILIGHSYGVSFCTFLAHEFLEQIHKMVLINGGGPTGLEPSSCFDLPTCVLHCLSPVLKWKFLKDGFAHQRAWQKRLLKDAFNVSPFVFRSVMNGQYWPEGNNIYHLKIKVPTLVVHGKHDKFVDIEEDQHMAKILPMGSLRVVEDGSHMVMMECPMDVNSLLHEFFR